jgi:hypothetical protein
LCQVQVRVPLQQVIFGGDEMHRELDHREGKNDPVIPGPVKQPMDGIFLHGQLVHDPHPLHEEGGVHVGSDSLADGVVEFQFQILDVALEAVVHHFAVVF